MKQKTMYFDYAASTPLDPAVEKEMARFGKHFFGNPGSLHRYGQEAMRGIDIARGRIAKSIGARFGEIVFTGSATEANNLALRGVIAAQRRSARIKTLRLRSGQAQIGADTPHIVISAIEHESIRETARDLEAQGVAVTWVPVDGEGMVNVDALRSALRDETVLVSVMYVNNEVGTIQPISAIADVIRNWKLANRNRQKITNYPASPADGQLPNYYPLFHTDAVQAFQYLDCDVDTLGVDLITLSAHKIYGPKGVGALYVRRGLSLPAGKAGVQGLGSRANKNSLNPSGYTLYPIVTGGGQEFGLRSGTENVAGIVGFGKAAEIAIQVRDKEKKRVTELRDYACSRFEKLLPKQIFINGSREQRIPNNINIYCNGTNAEDVFVRLDRKGIAISTGPACAARTGMPSEVLRAMGCSEERVRGSLRITLGRATSRREIDTLLRAFVELYSRNEK